MSTGVHKIFSTVGTDRLSIPNQIQRVFCCKALNRWGPGPGPGAMPQEVGGGGGAEQCTPRSSWVLCTYKESQESVF